MSEILRKIAYEPAALLGLAVAFMAFLVGFGWVDLSKEETALVLGLITAGLALVRQLVTPVAKLEDQGR